MALYSHNDPAALYWADKVARQQMRLQDAGPDVAAYQEIRLQEKDNIMCPQAYNLKRREYQRQ